MKVIKEGKVRNIEIPDDLFAWLQSLAVPLVDNTADVIARLRDEHERKEPQMAKPSTAESAPGNRPTESHVAEASFSGRSPRERGATIEIEGKRIRAISVREMYLQAMQFMVHNGHSARLKELIPFSTSSRRYLIADRPVHPSGNNFVVPVEYGGYFMETHKDYRNAFKHLSQLAEKLGLKIRYLG